MRPASSQLSWLVWGGLGALCAALLVALAVQQTRSGRTPAQPLPVLFTVPDFALTNQAGQLVKAADLRGQIWLADIIFTRCGGPCPEMTRRLAEIQTVFTNEAHVRLVSLTTDPGHDTPEVLAAYARRFGAIPGRWHFLTGLKRDIVALAVQGLKLTALDKDPAQQENPDDLFIHATLFVLMDARGNARAVFESDDPELMAKVKTAVTALLREN